MTRSMRLPRLAPSILAALTALYGLAMLALLRLLAQAALPVNSAYFPASDQNLLYVGRWDHSDPMNAHGLWIGSYVRTKFTGTSVTVKVGGHTGMDVSIDDELFRVVIGGPGIVPLNPMPLSPGTHMLNVGIKGGGGWDFQGLVLDAGAKTKPPARRPLIEFIGDSITCGSPGPVEAEGNYTSLTAQMLGCDHTQISWPGRSLTSGFGCADDKRGLDTQYFLRPCFYDSGPRVPWDFSTYTPQIVVINLGQNDACGNEPDNVFTASYIRFLQNIRAKFPKAQIVAMRMFGGGNYGADTKTAVDAVVSAGDSRVHYVDTAGWLNNPQDFVDGVHPNDQGDRKAAARLAPLLAPWLKKR